MADPSSTLVIFGATGDLMHRKLAPALYHLNAKGRLGAGVRILGVARRPWNEAEFRAEVQQSIIRYAGASDLAAWEDFGARLHYLRADVQAPTSFAALAKKLAEIEGAAANRLYYLAVAPQFFGAIVEGLGASGLAEEQGDLRRHIVIEKPFGRDLASAGELNGLVSSVFDEHQIFRIDHYLGKETAQNLILFRFANAIFEPLWNRNYIESVQISVAETVDVRQRTEYYDSAGVLRDMFQNHLMQLYALTAMEPAVPLNATTLRDEKVKVLKATRPIDLGNAVFGQYEGYRSTPGVREGSRTPTYAALKLELDNWRWQGVPFYLRSGKALARRTSEISIVFKRPPHRMFGAFQSPTPNVLSICVQPDEGVHLKFDAKVPDTYNDIRQVTLEFHYRSTFECEDLPDAYERLLLDALNGDASLFARNDEIENAWRLMDPVIAASEGNARSQPIEYVPGSWGPAESDVLLERDGNDWCMGCNHDATNARR
ncbi:MAG TPA: glucose-6-phosphate dehydrogenase [Steroidobacteraceae bacterium]|nr:glucose-6-phosphate dehydrogenase [Steroidobacteraceae bacterium]